MWLKLDDSYADHPKVEEAIGLAGPGAVLLHVRLMCYAAKHLTDGRVPVGAAKRLAHDAGPRALEALTDVGLIRLDGRDFELADWLDYNPPAEEVKAKRKARSERAKRAASARWDAKRNAGSNAQSIHPSNATRTSGGDAPVPVPVPSSPEGTATDDPSGQSATARDDAPPNEPNPHEPEEATPPTLRSVSDPPAEAVAKVVAILDTARGAPAASDPPRRSVEHLRGLVVKRGVGVVLDAARAFAADEHISTRGKRLAQFSAEFDKWSDLARNGGRPTSELAKTLALGSRAGTDPPAKSAAEMAAELERAQELCACGHKRTAHRFGAERCKPCGGGCEAFELAAAAAAGRS